MTILIFLNVIIYMNKYFNFFNQALSKNIFLNVYIYIYMS